MKSDIFKQNRGFSKIDCTDKHPKQTKHFKRDLHFVRQVIHSHFRAFVHCHSFSRRNLRFFLKSTMIGCTLCSQQKNNFNWLFEICRVAVVISLLNLGLCLGVKMWQQKNWNLMLFFFYPGVKEWDNSAEDIATVEMLSSQSSRPYTVGSFRMKLALFEQFIEEFTYVDEELNPEERQQILQARLTNGSY